ncbi:MAG: nuclear transport factor 2 family protein [Bradymonadaceae bacterium]|nr:nuclear transport factor 2 family protein [Lujinxingiaceae bacterium]
MAPFDIAKDFFRALQTGQFEWAERLLADDFHVRGWTREPMDKFEFLEVMHSLHEAFSDFSLDAHDLQQLHQGVWLTIQMSGTHDAVLDLPGIAPIEPTQRHFHLAEERPLLTIEGELITGFDVNSPPGAGLKAIFEQLGLESPYQARLPDRSEGAPSQGA